MDFGDYIYIIIALLFSVFSAIGKKRKAKNKNAKPSKARSIIEELFDTSEVEDPVTDPIYYDEDNEVYDEDEEWGISQPSKVVEPYNDMQAKLDSLYTKDPIDETEPVIVVKKETTTRKHSVISDLHNHNEIQKAIIYSEILKPKF